MPKFRGYIDDCRTLHSLYEERDITTVKIQAIHGENEHMINVSQIELTGTAPKMKKFIDARRAAIEKNDFAEATITIDLDEGNGSKVPSPLNDFPLSTLIALALN